MLPEDAASALRTLVGDRLSSSPSELDLHGRDASAHAPRRPDAVAWPETTAQVSAILSVCEQHRVPVTPFGVGSSVEGQAIPLAGGLTLDMSRMDRVLAIHAEDLTCHVQAGVRREDLDRRLGERGLLFGVDPGADATLGGMASTAASGTMTVRYGTMRENVLGLQAVLIDGTVVDAGSRARKSAAGYDLTRLLIGAEGTLAVIAELHLRVYGIPECVVAARCTFETTADVVEAVTELVLLGIPVARCEFLDPLVVRCVNEHSGLDDPERPTLLLELHGPRAAVDESIASLREIASEHGASDFHWAATTRERVALWHARHNAFFAVQALRPGARPYTTDVCVPISALADVVAVTAARIADLPFPAPMVGHVADGNFHCILLVRDDDPVERERLRGFLDDLVERALAAGGTCTGEHGIGIGKQDALRAEAGATGIAVMRRVKQALDPHGLLNPGKVLLDR